MKDTYTHNEAMEILGLVSHNAFLQLRRKYPDAFVVTKKNTGKKSVNLYDKQALDKFVEIRKSLLEKGQP